MDQHHPNNIYILGEYVLTYDASMKVEMFSCESYHGIIFFMGNGKYELINNYHMGPRIISLKDGSFHDIPFKPDTFYFLPPGVRACELTKERFIDVNFAH